MLKHDPKDDELEIWQSSNKKDLRIVVSIMNKIKKLAIFNLNHTGISYLDSEYIKIYQELQALESRILNRAPMNDIKSRNPP
jgi:hypothetical protein